MIIGDGTLQEMARTMIHENNLAKHLWAEVVNTSCYVQNRIYIRHMLEKTTYELFKGKRHISLTFINLDVLVTF